MLRGSIVFKYLTADNTPFKEKYNVIGVDTSVCLYLDISTNSYRGISVMSGDTSEENDLWSRRVNVNVNSVAVQCKYEVDENNKIIKKFGYNSDFFTSLAAFIRYAKFQCKTSNAVDYTGFASSSGEFIPETETQYNIPDATGNIVGTVSLLFGEIKAVHISNMWFDIDLDDDENQEVPVFPQIKNSLPVGFKLSQEFLGFQPAGVLGMTNQVGVVDWSADALYRDINEVIAAHPEKELGWLLGKNYIIVTDDMLDELIDTFMAVPDDDYIYCDTETTGLNICFKSRIGQADQCVGVILSYEDGVSYYFPMQMKGIPNLCGGDHFYLMNKLKPVLESKKLVGHNAPFDWKVCYIYDINANFVEDTMAMIALTLGVEKENYPLGLKDNAKILLHRDSLELDDLVRNNEWGEGDFNFADLPAELVRLYACADTDNTRGIFKYIEANDLLQRYGATRVYRIEVTFGLAVAYQEFYGHWIDVNRIESLKAEIAADIKSNMTEMVNIVGYEFNPNSPKQLVDIMYNQLGIPEQRDRKTGRLSTSKEVLKHLGSLTDVNNKPMYPFVKYLQQYRISEGIRKILSQFNSFATQDGYVFSQVMQYGTTTGRVSIKTPNYQSYNDIVKKYVCPRPGYYMSDTDYSSVEYRITGNMSGNKMIKEGFYDPDFDYHRYQAARMYGVPYASVSDELRKAAKGFNFGIPYGMGNESLGVRIFGEATPENTRKAAELHKKYFAGGQEDVEFFFENTRDKAVANGYTETYFGRRRYYHRNRFSIPAIRRQAGNAVIQGCLDGYTLIETKEFGVRAIKTLVNYSGLIWNGSAWTHGDVLYSGKKQKCIITFEGDFKFICSPIHKFLLSGKDPSDIKNYVECKDLTSEHIIQCNSAPESKLIRFTNDSSVGLRVKSVEITDEYIDMYDVCNTDCGYYVADGIVTHNTAADIYKLAVGRMFLRVCKEGWLGKVLFPGFIHDELLLEVHNSIDPMVFLKTLREEFEVKIDGWCPLYMGFGFGMSWYQAKKTELPIQLQWELVDKYGNEGYPRWNGNGVDLCVDIDNILRDFSVRHCKSEMTKAEYQGKEIKPALNGSIVAVLKEDDKLYRSVVMDMFKQSGLPMVNAEGAALTDSELEISEAHQEYLKVHMQELLDALNKVCISTCAYTDAGNIGISCLAANNIILKSKKDTIETQLAIDVFCKMHDLDRGAVNLLSIDTSDVAEKKEELMSDDLSADDSNNEELLLSMDKRVDTLGLFVDNESNMIVLKLVPESYMKFIKSKSNADGVGYRIRFKDAENKKLYDTNAYIASENVQLIQQMYIMYFQNVMST